MFTGGMFTLDLRNHSLKLAFTNRQPPENPSGPVEQAFVENLSCPDCASGLVPDGFEEVTVTDLPEPVQPVTTTSRLEVCRCARCGGRVRARHPWVPDDQTGATAHRVGDRAQSGGACAPLSFRHSDSAPTEGPPPDGRAFDHA